MTPRSATFLVVLSSLALGSCQKNRGGDGEDEQAAVRPVVAVRVVPVRTGRLVESITATGKIDVLKKQKIVSPVAGLLLSLKVLEGNAVRGGELLAVVRPKEAQAAITGAERMMQSARTETERSEARSALTLARSAENSVNLLAGFSGVVFSRTVTEGELVTENQELLTVVDLASIVFVAEVPLPDAPRVRKGASAVLEFPSLPGQKCPATVDAVYPGSELQSQTVAVRLRLAPGAAGFRRVLRPSMIGTCRIMAREYPAVFIVPKSALLRDDEKGTTAVVVATPDSVGHVLPVTVAVTTDSLAGITGAGLADGMPVVVEGNYALPDSTKVTW